ncbi:hypothetical protein BDQ17DRAFT_1262106 [Cyathus striatus]|nr:hypothetical protein BDQ17DRAFT_1262106 [Cyathus striatus]
MRSTFHKVTGLHLLGLNLTCMTQSKLYKAIKHRKKTKKCVASQCNIEITAQAIKENAGLCPSPESIWKSILQGATLTKKAKTFLWKVLHGSLKIGKYWEHTPLKDQHMPCIQCHADVEDISHILLNCQVSGQEHVWNIARATWQSTGLPWPCISISLIMGISLAVIKSEDGDMLKAPTCLFRILVSEAAYLIWKLRCEWCIGEEANPLKLHTPQEIESRWINTINTRINYDKILTDSRAYGKRALKHILVQNTWQSVLDTNQLINTIPDNWLSKAGVLVGIKELTHYQWGQNR